MTLAAGRCHDLDRRAARATGEALGQEISAP
jgi:hypothetical protein